MTPEFTKERDALRATNRQLAEANAALTARVAEFDAVCESLHQTRAEAAGLETDLKEARTLNAQLTDEMGDVKADLDYARQCESALHERLTEVEVELADTNALNAQLAAQVDDARRQRDECAATAEIHAQSVDDALDIIKAMAPECISEPDCGDECVADAQARASDAFNAAQAARYSEPTPLAAVTTHTEAIAVTVERSTTQPDVLIARTVDDQIAVTTDEAVALIAALLADGRVHGAWLHGRGGK